jgi:hypothetical protein
VCATPIDEVSVGHRLKSVYIFGTGDCKKKFEAAPENYLEGEAGAKPKAALTPEALSKGHSLLEKAVAAMGGAARIDSLTGYQEKSTVQQTRRTGDVEVKTNLTILFPDLIKMTAKAILSASIRQRGTS